MRAILILWILLLTATTPSFAESVEPKSSPVQKQEIVGTWRVVAFFPGTFGQKYPDSDLLAPSQIYGFYEDGHARNIVSDQNKNFAYNLNELEMRFGKKPQNIHYNFIKNGLMAITTDKNREIGTLWQAHRVDEAGILNDLQTQQGDVIMGMTPEKNSKTDDFRYIRIMRKVQ